MSAHDVSDELRDVVSVEGMLQRTQFVPGNGCCDGEKKDIVWLTSERSCDDVMM